MKWPKSLVFIRHGESEYNALKTRKNELPYHKEFIDLYEKDLAAAEDESWPSGKLQEMARELWRETRLAISDYDTPLTEAGKSQAVETGTRLSKTATLPDVIYVSPYLRTRQTLAGLQEGWPELASVKVVSEERIREQEHGLSTVYNDWRVYYTLNPVQGLLSKIEGPYEYRFLNGENKADVRDRIRSFISTLLRENKEQNVLVISHHLSLLCLRANLERWGREKFNEVDHQEKPINCGVTTYIGDPSLGEDGRFVLESYNQKYY